MNPVKIEAAAYRKYHNSQEYRNDSPPLYVADAEILHVNEDLKRRFYDPIVPEGFYHSALSYEDRCKRAALRWLLIGKDRSYSSLHREPKETSVWVYLYSGTKIWYIFSPDVNFGDVELFTLKHVVDETRILQNHLQNIMHEYPDSCIYHEQEPGETIVIPNGWWHIVFNKTDGVVVLAVAENFLTDGERKENDNIV